MSATHTTLTPEPVMTRVKPGLLQRKCECGGTCESCREPEKEKTTGLLQQRANSSGRAAPGPAHVPPAVTAQIHNAAQGGGHALPAPARSFMETRFGNRDFSSVRVHADSTADHLAHQLGAEAFTVGNNIFFAANRYDHSSPAGQRLLAHELTHVVPQGGGARQPESPLPLVGPNDHCEEEAERVSAQIMSTPQRSQPAAGPQPFPAGTVVQRSPGPGGITIPLPDFTIFRRFQVTRPWSGSTGNIPLVEKPVDIPYVGPVVFALYVRGDALASLGAGVGPGLLRNISVTLDPLAGRYSGTAELFVPADVLANLVLTGTVGGTAHWLGLVEVAKVEGLLMGSGTGGATGAFMATAEVSYASGGIGFTLGTELDTCLVFNVSLDAMATATLLSHPVWGRSWHLAGYSWRRCWRLGATLRLRLAGGAPSASLDLNAQAIPVSELLPELLVESHGAGALLGAKHVPVHIRGGSELWWFDGLKPVGYPLEQGLTGDAGGLPGTFRWAVTRGISYADLDGFPTAVGPATKLKSKAESMAPDDVEIKLEFHGAGGETGLDTRKFRVGSAKSLSFLRNDDRTDPAYAYVTFIHYSILDQFGTVLPRDIHINEHFTAAPTADFPGMDWRRGSEGAAFVHPADWNDMVQGETAGHTPMPVKPADPAAGVAVYHWPGTWQVGSSSIGVGKRVKSITWQKFRGRARHI